MNPPLEPWNDPTLEARVVAFLLGEASAFERAEIDRLLSESPELAAFARRIRALHGLLGEATCGGADDHWKMDPDRRGKLLLALGAPAPASQTVALPAPKRHRRRRFNLLALAACIAFGLVTSTLFFSAGLGRLSNAAHYALESTGINSKEKEMVALRTELPTEMRVGTPKDLSGVLAAHEKKLEVAASAPSKPSSSASVLTKPSAPPPPPAAAAEPLAIRWPVEARPTSGEQAKQVAFTAKNVEVRQRNTEELGYGWIVSDANGKLQGQGQAVGLTAAGGEFKKPGTAEIARRDGQPTGTEELEGFANYDAPIASETNGSRSGNAPVKRAEIDRILDGMDVRRDELARREDDATVEVVRELKPGDVSDFAASERQGVIGAGVATQTPFPVTPATPTFFQERVDSFGNTVAFPTEYEPPELPWKADRPREDVSKVSPDEAPLLGDTPVVGRLFRDRWEATPTTEDAAAAASEQMVSGKPGAYGGKKSDADVDPFAGETKKPKPEEKSPAPEKRVAPTMENKLTEAEPVSTFSLHVSDASFQLGARALLGGGAFPAPESVRAEDYINAMDYGDAMPARGEAVSAVIQQSGQPFVPGRNLVRIGVRTAADGRAKGQPLSLVLLVDQSGSMERPDRVAAMDRALGELAGLLGKDDTITVVGFAREPRLLADRWTGEKAGELPALIRNSPPQGGTNLEAALDLAAEVAARQAKPRAQNRIVLFTDGAANLGQVKPEALAARVEALRRQRIAFDACGVGTAELADNVLEAMARRGDGRYLVLDAEGETSLAKQLAGAFRPAARNVKVQVRFNPERVEAYQLFGFEKHLLNEEDFRDDSVDAAELAAAEQGNALYQLRLRADGTGDIGDVAVRFQDTTTGRMVERHWTIHFDPATPSLDQAAPAMQLAAAAGLLAEKLRGTAIGQSVDPAVLAGVQSNLRSAFPNDSRVETLLAMWEQLRRSR